MKTIKTSLLLFLVITTLFSCRKDQIHGSGTTASQDRELAGFENVLIKGAIRTNIIYGTDFRVTVTTDPVVMSHVETRVEDNTLILDLDDHYNYQHISFTVDVVMPLIHNLTHEGISTSSLSGFYDLNELHVRHNGVGKLDLSGSAAHLDLEHDGVGSVNAFNFPVQTCHAGQSGVGSVKVTVSDLLEGHLNGVGNIYYRGQPEVNISDSGVGNVIHQN
ncbi:MAG: DUF2807 domain-containing protein [Flavobacteriales bacterium]|nr:DUF2807 domain-containing protein [Flavobacteriales bacterium]MBK6945962.1 DUF2807 domain-containing protein [Flavobacteriales bacterium]MBK7239100.1 DUF2807 domain-containing protein [Flavobacteriales bacterium]MBK9536795.1 DUF2807 domain-containing protein [Flavobacteriales bacterium]MBP9138181.1 DUF2807 domain-containing protein [Flavobacteriales bacterium]